jgi:hypothetical protein
MAAFKGILMQNHVPIMIAILVDGLDEFDGDHEEIVEILKETGTVQTVKVCLSSRPWVVFKDSFSGFPRLLLQNLTYRDIELYTRDRFEKSPAFRRLAAEEQESKSALIQKVVQKAEGVFLWVRLVVTSLLKGIRNRDGIQDLRERLRQIPEDLDRLYSHLLNLIEPIYRTWASMAFQVIRAARELEKSPFKPANIVCDPRLRFVPLILGEFSLGMNDSFDCCNTQQIGSKSLDFICQTTATHITARCGGLLEVSCPGHKREVCRGASIGYLHRTARDYLEKPSHWSKVTAWAASMEFSPYFTLLKGCIRLLSLDFIPKPCIKDSASELIMNIQSAEEHAEELILSAMIYAYHTNSQPSPISSETRIILLDQLDSIVAKKGRGISHWSGELDYFTACIESQFTSFLDLATHYQLSRYIRENWPRNRKAQIQWRQLYYTEFCIICLESFLHYLTYVSTPLFY